MNPFAVSVHSVQFYKDNEATVYIGCSELSGTPRFLNDDRALRIAATHEQARWFAERAGKTILLRAEDL